MLKTIDNIKLLIADNKIEQATNDLFQLAKNETALLNQVILLKNQFKDYTHNINLNLMERNEERAKVINGLLYIADEIANSLKQNGQKVNDTEGYLMQGSGEVLAVLWLNMYGYLTKKLDIVMASIHQQSPIYGQIADYTQQVFMHDLTYNMVSLEVLTEEETQVRVKMVLETRARKPSIHFKNNLWTGIQYLCPDEQGHWKIWSGETLELKYI